MNHINWVQQDPDYQTKYHVLKWESSHFHEPQARQMLNSALHKEGAAFAVSAKQEETKVLEDGLGSVSSVKSGGFAFGRGQDGMILQDNVEAEKGQDSVAISVQGAERQSVDAGTQTALRQSEEQHIVAQQTSIQQPITRQNRMPEDQKQDRAASERVTTAAAGQGGIRSRLKESAAHLQEAYQKQKQRIKKTLFRAKRAEKKPEPQKKSGRKADREEILSMQARNHYLLDSYDRNGQYHMLGK